MMNKKLGSAAIRNFSTVSIKNDSTRQNIILIGIMGSGKTTLARALAKRLQWTFLDTDEQIEKQYRQRISQIFKKKGRPFFRTAETKLLKKLLSKKVSQHVIATGGGMILRPENQEMLRQLGTVIYLKAYPNTLSRRLRKMTDRPLLPKESQERADVLRMVLKLRKPKYERTAHEIIRVDHKSPREVVATILAKSKALSSYANGRKVHVNATWLKK